LPGKFREAWMTASDLKLVLITGDLQIRWPRRRSKERGEADLHRAPFYDRV
jgi:hypothetical protein